MKNVLTTLGLEQIAIKAIVAFVFVCTLGFYLVSSNAFAFMVDPNHAKDLEIARLKARIAELESESKLCFKFRRDPIHNEPVYAETN